MNVIQQGFHGDSWWSRVVVTGAGAADLKALIASTAASDTARRRRLVVTGWSISGHNTNGTATTFVIRNKTTTTTIFKGGSMLPTVGSFQDSITGLWLPGAVNEAIEINVAGAITGQIDVTLFGRVISGDAPFQTRNVTGAA